MTSAFYTTQDQQALRLVLDTYLVRPEPHLYRSILDHFNRLWVSIQYHWHRSGGVDWMGDSCSHHHWNALIGFTGRLAAAIYSRIKEHGPEPHTVQLLYDLSAVVGVPTYHTHVLPDHIRFIFVDARNAVLQWCLTHQQFPGYVMPLLFQTPTKSEHSRLGEALVEHYTTHPSERPPLEELMQYGRTALLTAYSVSRNLHIPSLADWIRTIHDDLIMPIVAPYIGHRYGNRFDLNEPEIYLAYQVILTYLAAHCLPRLQSIPELGLFVRNGTIIIDPTSSSRNLYKLLSPTSTTPQFAFSGLQVEQISATYLSQSPMIDLLHRSQHFRQQRIVDTSSWPDWIWTLWCRMTMGIVTLTTRDNLEVYSRFIPRRVSLPLLGKLLRRVASSKTRHTLMQKRVVDSILEAVAFLQPTPDEVQLLITQRTGGSNHEVTTHIRRRLLEILSVGSAC